jgi:hypothetical protein
MYGEHTRLMEERVCIACGNTFLARADRDQRACSHACGGQLSWATRPYSKDRIPQGNGYVWARVDDPAHPTALKLAKKGRSRYVLEHRLVMERKLGRYLDPRERVHHRNGVRDDNRVENLELWTLDHKDPAGVRTTEVPHCPTCTCAIHEARA